MKIEINENYKVGSFIEARNKSIKFRYKTTAALYSMNSTIGDRQHVINACGIRLNQKDERKRLSHQGNWATI